MRLSRTRKRTNRKYVAENAATIQLHQLPTSGPLTGSPTAAFPNGTGTGRANPVQFALSEWTSNELVNRCRQNQRIVPEQPRSRFTIRLISGASGRRVNGDERGVRVAEPTARGGPARRAFSRPWQALPVVARSASKAASMMSGGVHRGEGEGGGCGGAEAGEKERGRGIT